MEHIFNTDGKFFSAFSRLADLILLNALFILACIPVITTGAALCALYQTTLKMAGGRESYIHRDFFQNLKQGLHPNGTAGLLSIGCICLCLVNIISLPTLYKGAVGMTLLCLQLLFLLFLYLFLLYISILPKAYRRTLKNAARNAFYLALKYLPSSLICLCISLLPAGCVFLFTARINWIVSFLLTAGFSSIAFIHSFLLLKILKKEKIEDPDAH